MAPFGSSFLYYYYHTKYVETQALCLVDHFEQKSRTDLHTREQNQSVKLKTRGKQEECEIFPFNFQTVNNI